MKENQNSLYINKYSKNKIDINLINYNQKKYQRNVKEKNLI